MEGEEEAAAASSPSTSRHPQLLVKLKLPLRALSQSPEPESDQPVSETVSEPDGEDGAQGDEGPPRSAPPPASATAAAVPPPTPPRTSSSSSRRAGKGRTQAVGSRLAVPPGPSKKRRPARSPKDTARAKHAAMREAIADILYENALYYGRLQDLGRREQLLIRERRFLLERLLQHEPIDPRLLEGDPVPLPEDPDAPMDWAAAAAEYSTDASREARALRKEQAALARKRNPAAPKKAAHTGKAGAPKSASTAASCPRDGKASKASKSAAAKPAKPPKPPKPLKPRKCRPVPRDADGKAILPLVVANVTIHTLGTVDSTRPGFHVERYIYPIGFYSSRTWTDPEDPSKTTLYHSRIVDDGLDWPLFRVTCDAHPDLVWLERSPSACHTKALIAVNNARGRPEASHSGSGPDWFGFGYPAVAKLIQELPGADKCFKYRMQEFIEATPRPTKKAAAKKKAASTAGAKAKAGGAGPATPGRRTQPRPDGGDAADASAAADLPGPSPSPPPRKRKREATTGRPATKKRKRGRRVAPSQAPAPDNISTAEAQPSDGSAPTPGPGGSAPGSLQPSPSPPPPQPTLADQQAALQLASMAILMLQGGAAAMAAQAQFAPPIPIPIPIPAPGASVPPMASEDGDDEGVEEMEEGEEDVQSP